MRQVYAVHAVRLDAIAATSLVTTSQDAAEKYAAEMSNDPGVLAGAVTRFTLDTPGQRTAVALFVAGRRQQTPYVSDNRLVYANGYDSTRPRP